MAAATGMMAIVSYIMVLILPLTVNDDRFLESFPKFCVIVAVSLAAYVWFSRLLHLPEAKPVIRVGKQLLYGKLLTRK